MGIQFPRRYFDIFSCTFLFFYCIDDKALLNLNLNYANKRLIWTTPFLIYN